MKVSDKAVNILTQFQGECREYWTDGYHNSVGYWTYVFGPLSIQRGLCIHVLYNDKELATYFQKSPEYDAIAKAMEAARQREKSTALEEFLRA